MPTYLDRATYAQFSNANLLDQLEGDFDTAVGRLAGPQPGPQELEQQYQQQVDALRGERLLGLSNDLPPAPASPVPVADGVGSPASSAPSAGTVPPPPGPTVLDTPIPDVGQPITSVSAEQVRGPERRLQFSAPGAFSPFDEVFRRHAGDLAQDPTFLAIVAAGTRAESGWDAQNTSGDGGHSWGLFQLHDAGAGAGMGAARLDPDAASAVMVPRYAAAYRQAQQQMPGLSGPALASWVAAQAERPQGYDDPHSSARRAYAAAFEEVTGQAGQRPGAAGTPAPSLLVSPPPADRSVTAPVGGVPPAVQADVSLPTAQFLQALSNQYTQQVRALGESLSGFSTNAQRQIGAAAAGAGNLLGAASQPASARELSIADEARGEQALPSPPSTLGTPALDAAQRAYAAGAPERETMSTAMEQAGGALRYLGRVKAQAGFPSILDPEHPANSAFRAQVNAILTKQARGEPTTPEEDALLLKDALVIGGMAGFSGAAGGVGRLKPRGGGEPLVVPGESAPLTRSVTILGPTGEPVSTVRPPVAVTDETLTGLGKIDQSRLSPTAQQELASEHAAYRETRVATPQAQIDALASETGLSGQEIAQRWTDRSTGKLTAEFQSLRASHLQAREDADRLTQALQAPELDEATRAVTEVRLADARLRQSELLIAHELGGSEAGRLLGSLSRPLDEIEITAGAQQWQRVRALVEQATNGVARDVERGTVAGHTQRQLTQLKTVLEREVTANGAAGGTRSGTAVLEREAGAPTGAANAPRGNGAVPSAQPAQVDPLVEKAQQIARLNQQEAAARNGNDWTAVRRLQDQRDLLLDDVTDTLRERLLKAREKAAAEPRTAATMETVTDQQAKSVLATVRRQLAEELKPLPEKAGATAEAFSRAFDRGLARYRSAALRDIAEPIRRQIVQAREDATQGVFEGVTTGIIRGLERERLSATVGVQQAVVRQMDRNLARDTVAQIDALLKAGGTQEQRRAALGLLDNLRGVGRESTRIAQDYRAHLNERAVAPLVRQAMKAATPEARAAEIKRLAAEMTKVDYTDVRAVQRLAQTMAKDQPRTASELHAYRIASMIGPGTELVNALGGALEAGFAVPTRLVAGVKGLKTGEAHPVQALDEIVGFVQGLKPAAKDALETLRTGISSRPIRELGGHTVTRIPARFPTIGGAVAGGFTANAETPEGATPGERAVRIATGVAAGTLGGRLIGTPASTGLLRGLAASDDFFRAINVSGAQRAEARLVARRTGQSVDDVLLNVVQHPEIVRNAAQLSAERGYNVPLKGWAQAASQLRQTPVVTQFVPFFNTLANIGQRATEYGGGGFAVGRQLRAAGNPTLAAYKEAQATLGLTVAGAMAWQTLAGNLTGYGPADPAERRDWLDQGGQPWSARIGDEWKSYQQLGAMGVVIGTAATLAEALRKGMNGRDAGKILTEAVLAEGHLALNTVGLTGLADLLSAMDGSDPKAFERVGSNVATSYMPLAGTTAAVARSVDPGVKDVRTLEDAVLSRLPFLSRQVPNKQTQLGQDRERSNTGPAALLPIRATADRPSPVLQEYQRLRALGQTVSLGDAGHTIDGVKLTRAEQDAYERVLGPVLDKRLTALIGERYYQAATPARQVALLAKAESHARDQAVERFKRTALPYTVRRERKQQQRQPQAPTPFFGLAPLPIGR